jgi:hypothetical protein
MKDNLIDISDEVFGKYVHCTKYGNHYYADEDFTEDFGFGRPRYGSVADDGHMFGFKDWLASVFLF